MPTPSKVGFERRGEGGGVNWPVAQEPPEKKTVKNNSL